MVSLTLSIPDELKREMDKHPEFNWSEVARQSIRKKLALAKKMDELLSDSELTEEDVIELGKKVNKEVAKEYKEKTE